MQERTDCGGTGERQETAASRRTAGATPTWNVLPSKTLSEIKMKYGAALVSSPLLDDRDPGRAGSQLGSSPQEMDAVASLSGGFFSLGLGLRRPHLSTG